MEQFNSKLPQWASLALKIFVHPDFQEEIEGDLSEKYSIDVEKYGYNVANKQLFAGLFSLIKFNLVFNLNQNSVMKSQNWLAVLLINMAFILAAVAPFLPGPTNSFSHNVSQFAQIIGYIGLFLMPFGLIWLIVEIRNKKDQKLNKWTNGYYPALLTISPFLVLLIIQISIGVRESFKQGWNEILFPFLFIFTLLTVLFYLIHKLKTKTEYKFNPVPVYIVILPLTILLITNFVVDNAATSCRENVIKKTEPLITAIEKHKAVQGYYPEKLEDLVGSFITEIPTFNIMGLHAYQYEKWGDTFQLSFEQNWHWSATDVVVYVKSGHSIMKNTYENFPTSNPDWRYYMVD